MNKSTTIAIASVLVAGAAVGAFRAGVIGPQYAEVVRTTPVAVREPIYADVLDAVAITQTNEVPTKVCADQSVRVRQPERHGNKDGMVAGALIGGLLGNQVGQGDGRKAATVAGVIGGGFAGREIDRRHVGGPITTELQRVCRTEMKQQSSIIGYEVHYLVNGELLSKRVSKKPSDQIWLGERDKVIGYDVDWSYRDRTGTIRMDEKPGKRLRMQDGAIVLKDRPTAGDKG